VGPVAVPRAARRAKLTIITPVYIPL
jgi:hypothetical protein